jgi:predicted lysophospholipase L1 biosynthesis ABC-type transport system permease subunit
MNKRNEWMREVELRQRNIVFPDTAANEARFWKNIVSGKLTKVQIIGVIVYVGAVAALTWVTAKEMISIVGLIFLGGCGAAFLLLRWRVRKALAGAHKQPRVAK